MSFLFYFLSRIPIFVHFLFKFAPMGLPPCPARLWRPRFSARRGTYSPYRHPAPHPPWRIRLSAPGGNQTIWMMLFPSFGFPHDGFLLFLLHSCSIASLCFAGNTGDARLLLILNNSNNISAFQNAGNILPFFYQPLSY